MTELSAFELGRYARQVAMPQWGIESQQRLAKARVLVIGAGGLGSASLPYLVAAGVGHVGIVDFDVVTLSNLPRQVLHDQSQLGHSKVASALQRLSALNDQVTVTGYDEALTAENALELVGGYDIVVDGSDNFPTRYLTADACVLAHRPLVWASVLGFDGQMSVFDADRGPCLRCVFPEPPPAGAVPSCAEAGVLPVVPGIMGVAQAAEVLKLVSGVGEPTIGLISVYDGLTGAWDQVPVRRDPDCRLCGPDPQITTVANAATQAPDDSLESRTLTAADVAVWLEQRERGERNFTLLDIREPHEWSLGVIPGATLLSMGDVLAGDLPSSDGPYLLYCHGGVRSARTVEKLLSDGTDAFHLGGGIDAWSVQIDPSIQRY